MVRFETESYLSIAGYSYSMILVHNDEKPIPIVDACAGTFMFV